MKLRPEPSEYAPFYAGYIALVGGNEIIPTLYNQSREADMFFSKLPEDQAAQPYAPGKWTGKEVIGHLIDTERIMAYRALRIARNDKTNLPGFEQDDYVQFCNAANRPLMDLAEEFNWVRYTTLLLLKSFDADAWSRRGMANNHEVTVRALAYIMAGHELHHRKTLARCYNLTP